MSTKRRSAISIMAKLIVLIKPLLHIMLLAIILGTAGYLCAIFITILAARVVLIGIGEDAIRMTGAGTIIAIMICIAIARGLLHYAEQYCNHFIAFKLLAIIRHEVFAALRRLCPAKLEGKDRGNLISVITSDIELLEVFYAHTISPIAIAFLTSLIMVGFIGHFSGIAALLALTGYICVGIILPLTIGRLGKDVGMAYREGFGELNSYVLDSLRGVDESIQYGQGEAVKQGMTDMSKQLATQQKKLNQLEKLQRSLTNTLILIFSFGMLALTVYLNKNNQIDFSAVIICTIAMMGSFGPTVALSNLSNNLNQTLASGERVLSILEEQPAVEEVKKTEGMTSESEDFEYKKAIDAKLNHVSFAYQEEEILKDYSAYFEKGKITGIHGASGSGKSTMLKLLMRFWDANKGSVSVDKKKVKDIPTSMLRSLEGYVLQDTELFHDSIEANIGIGKENATREEIVKAAKKASIHDFIMSLPDGYETKIGELGDTLSGGEKQRIGIARAFLHDAPLMLLDEPTSNLDSLNEGIILKSLLEEGKDKTVILVSHRKSTMSVAEHVIELDR